jgi:hypothetical protein
VLQASLELTALLELQVCAEPLEARGFKVNKVLQVYKAQQELGLLVQQEQLVNKDL